MKKNENYYFKEYIDSGHSKAIQELNKDMEEYSGQDYKIVGYTTNEYGQSMILAQVFDGSEYYD